MNVFCKLKDLRSHVEKEMGVISDIELCKLTQRLANQWHYKNGKKGFRLSKQEAQLYEIYVKNHYNPSTVYKWLLLARTPQELREKIKQGSISQREAWAQKSEFRSCFNVSDKQLLHNIKDAVERYIIR